MAHQQFKPGLPQRNLVYAWEGEVDGLKAEIGRLRAALSEENLTKVYTMARGNYIKHTFDGDWGDAPHDYEERYIGWFMSKHAIEQKEPTHSGGVDSHG